MNKNALKIKRLVGVASLASLVVVLQLLSNYVTIGALNITLALIPIVVGSIVYGPLAGFGLGAIMGVIVLTAPSTLAFFMPVNPFATILLCILKSGLAGLVAGYLYRLTLFITNKLAKDNNKIRNAFFYVAVVLATLIVPVINTGLFIFGAALFFQGVYGAENFATAVPIIIGAVFTTNFLIEFIVSVVLSPSVVFLVKVLANRFDLGFTLNIDDNSSQNQKAIE